MKPISNFRDHPALKYDEQKAVFIMNCSSIPELFLYTEKEVERIIPIAIKYTNIGEPYKELVRLVFLVKNKEEDYIDIDPNNLQDLSHMLYSINSLLPIPDRFNRYLDSYENE